MHDKTSRNAVQERRRRSGCKAALEDVLGLAHGHLACGRAGDDGVVAGGSRVEGVLDLFQFQDAKLVEHWALLDYLGLLRQIGVSSI